MTKNSYENMFIIGKIIFDEETNFTQHKYNKLQKISAKIRATCKSANMGSSTVQLHGVDLIDIQVQNWL